MSNDDNEAGGVDYWLRWQVLTCGAIIVIPAAAAAAVIARAREKKPLRQSDLWVPCWRGVHPLWLLAYRALVVPIMSWFLYQVLLADPAYAFYFYTQWTFALVIIYFVIATLVSAHGCWIHSRKQGIESEEANWFLKRDAEDGHATLTFRTDKISETIRLQSENDQQVNEKRAGTLGHVMQIVYQTSAGAVVLTDLVFWGLLVPTSAEHFSVDLVMACVHSLNAVFLLLDTALNSLPFPLFRMSYYVFWSATYVTFQWVMHACGLTWWPYPFLELATPWAPLWYIAMALVHVPSYGSYWLIVKAKNTFFPKFFPNAYIRSS